METIVERPAGLDVHKAQMTACVQVPQEGGDREQQVAEFPTTLTVLLTLRDWLCAHLITHGGFTRWERWERWVWAARFPDEVPLVNGEYEWIARSLADLD